MSKKLKRKKQCVMRTANIIYKILDFLVKTSESNFDSTSQLLAG